MIEPFDSKFVVKIVMKELRNPMLSAVECRRDPTTFSSCGFCSGQINYFVNIDKSACQIIVVASE